MMSARNTVVAAGIVGLILLIATLVAPMAQNALTPLRPPTDRESFDYLIAVTFEQPQLCDRIDSRALGSGGGWGGRPEESLQSLCRRGLAGPIAVPHSLNMGPFIGFVRAMGYGDREVVEAKYRENPENSPTLKPFAAMKEDAAFLARLRAAPDYAESAAATSIRPARPVEVLYQMVAVDSGDPALCERISPNVTLDARGGTSLLRVHCIAAIAHNTRNAPLCGRLPAVGSSPLVVNFNSAEGCRKNIELLRSATGLGRHGAIPFGRAPDFAAALQTIGFSSDAVTRAATPPEDEYWEFVSRLRFRGPADARAEFVRRALALPR